jgi:DNA invertase Pin-like site-specific DNA recombinase
MTRLIPEVSPKHFCVSPVLSIARLSESHLTVKSEYLSSDHRVIRAAQYLRMSTEHQQYSLDNQSVAIVRYAEANRMTIVRTFEDGGRSGLVLSGRTGMQELLAAVQGGSPDFEVVLVYDVSRWGRYQDSDEGIYYEYICKRAGIAVHYCAELFPNDTSLTTAVLKTIKRTMAGEYSRELSVKVFAGQCRLIELGYRQGGPPGFGLRRQLIAQDRTPKGILARGEHKSIQTDRVILVPGPPDEVAVVREIYDQFTKEDQSETTIADALNGRGILTDLGRPWTRATIRQILTNPKYAGANVFNRRSFKLKKQRVTNPPDIWVRRDGAFEALIRQEQFLAAQTIIENRHHNMTDEQMLTELRGVLAAVGRLSGVLIDETPGIPSSSAYCHRFGSLYRAYSLVGYQVSRDYSYVEINRMLRRLHADLCASIMAEVERAGASIERNSDTDLLTVNQEFTTSVVLSRCRTTSAGRQRWLIRLEDLLRPDITVAARLTPPNDAVLDYFIFPGIDSLTEELLSDRNPLTVDVYRFDDLSTFIQLARRAQIEAA